MDELHQSCMISLVKSDVRWCDTSKQIAMDRHCSEAAVAYQAVAYQAVACLAAACPAAASQLVASQLGAQNNVGLGPMQGSSACRGLI